MSVHPPLFDNRIGLFHRGASDTEREAAIAIYPKTGTQLERVYQAIRASGSYGRTYPELMADTGLLLQSICGRVGTLKRDNLVADSGKRRPSPISGFGNIVWVAVEQVQVGEAL